MAAHTHLDRGMRAPGECPGCDERWKAQRERLITIVRPRHKTVKELARLAPVPAAERRNWCRAMLDVGRETHTCGHEADHEGDHWCPICKRPWPSC